MELITKRDFCKRCGISMPTCYKWIEKDKDGLKAFVHEDGIDAALFDLAPWNTYKSEGAKKDEATARRILDLEQQLEQEREAAARAQEQAQQTIQQQADIISLLREQLHVMMNRQLQALPQPRRTFLEWLGIKKPQEPAGN